MIIVTGACGFIGSNLVAGLNSVGHDELILVDNLNKESKFINLRGKNYQRIIDATQLFDYIYQNHKEIECIFHLGAKTDTTSTNFMEFDAYNYFYSQTLWRLCSQFKLPLIYASSAATYGLSKEFSDDEMILYPINPYARSKYDFDCWAMLRSQMHPNHFYGLKFFNVYGPNEYHKGNMSSVMFHFYNQVISTRKIKLYKSYSSEYRDGAQARDFVYVKDLVNVMLFLMEKKPISGLYNVGSGEASDYLEVASEVAFHAKSTLAIDFIDMPIGLREQYQYFTKADITKLRKAGYNKPMTSIGEGIADYVSNYLNSRYL